MKKVTQKTGEQGVLLVTAELLALGLNPYRPVIDDHGVDILLIDGVRVQVKAGHASKSKRVINSKNKVYQFSCCQNTYIQGSGRKMGLGWKRRIFSKECDFLVLVGLDERRFWVVPAAFVDARNETTLIVGPEAMPSGLEVRKMLEQGKELQDIAFELGCSITTVWKYIKGGSSNRSGGIRELRSYEGRWDLLSKPDADKIEFKAPMIYERDNDFVGTLAGPIAA